jgi:hypothetical protein
MVSFRIHISSFLASSLRIRNFSFECPSLPVAFYWKTPEAINLATLILKHRKIGVELLVTFQFQINSTFMASWLRIRNVYLSVHH